MKLGIRPCMLPEHVYGVYHELDAVKGIFTFPRRRRSVGGFSVKFIKEFSQCLELRHYNIPVVHMDHHCHIVLVEKTHIRHDAFGPIVLLVRGSDDVNICVQFILQIFKGQSGQHAYGTAEAVAAGMSDFWQSVIFCQQCDLVFMIVAAVHASESGLFSAERLFRLIAVIFQKSYQSGRCLVFPAGKFRIVSHVVAYCDHLVFVLCDLPIYFTLQLLICRHIFFFHLYHQETCCNITYK